MLKNYSLPVHIFLTLEKAKTKILRARTLKKNHNIIIMEKKWFVLFNKVLKNDIITSKSTLIDITSVDLSNYNSNDYSKLGLLGSFSDSAALYYQYYIYSNKSRITLIVNTKNSRMPSITSVFKNSSWLEREASEMLGINYTNAKDSRRLLLDYSKNENPLKKSFPCEGLNEYYYDTYSNQVNKIKINSTEL